MPQTPLISYVDYLWAARKYISVCMAHTCEGSGMFSRVIGLMVVSSRSAVGTRVNG